MYILYKWREPYLDQHNTYECAVQGYESDCKTPLTLSEKLK